MCLNNFRHGLSTTLMSQKFNGFNDLCTKAHNVEIHLNKHKKSATEGGGKAGLLLFATIALREKSLMVLALLC